MYMYLMCLHQTIPRICILIRHPGSEVSSVPHSSFLMPIVRNRTRFNQYLLFIMRVWKSQSASVGSQSIIIQSKH